MNTFMLWLDDLRSPGHHPHIAGGVSKTLWVRNYQEAIEILRISSEHITHVSLDNDLGEEKEGKDVLADIEQMLFYQKLPKVASINIHSHNPSAVQNMYSCRDYMKDRYNITVTKIRA